MNKALVVGGSSGVGLAIVCELLYKDYDIIYIVGKDYPCRNCVPEELIEVFDKKVVFKKTNLISFNPSVFEGMDDINLLMITSGFGRIASFDELTNIEIKSLIEVNFAATAQIIKLFYEKIVSTPDFYTGIMVSICGRICSPLFSVYGASKGGLRFLIENINSELIAIGSQNRITEVSPGFIKGTRFEGKENDLLQVSAIAREILESVFNKETLFIPQFNEVYKSVINRYNENPIAFGQESYTYKICSGRQSKKPQVVVGYLSGTFDLFHIGHLNLLRRAKEECDYLIVSVHKSGAWKGKETFIPYDERKAIVESIKYVDEVVEDCAEDSDAWSKYHFDKLFVGSDYKNTPRFNKYEKDLKGKATIIYFPYTEGTSSTKLRERIKKDD